jgi:hypothetical protein
MPTYPETRVVYTADGTTSTFSFSIPYLNAEDIVATINGVPSTFTVSGNAVSLDDTVSNGDEVVIARSTNIEEALVTFSNPSVLLDSDLNTAVTQLLYSCQEVNTRIDNLTLSGGAASNTPAPTAVSNFIVSQSNGAGGYAWTQKTTAQVAAILGVGNITLPSPLSGSRFLVTDASTATYELNTIAEVKTLLGITALVPTVNGQSNYFMTINGAGTDYELSSAASARSKLGLGNAALVNTGTGVGSVPLLIQGTSGAALPAVYGDLLLGVQKVIDYSVWTLKPAAAIILTNEVNSSTPNTSEAAGGTGWVPCTTYGGAGLSQEIAPVTAGWCQTHPSGVSLSPGKYLVDAEVVIYGGQCIVRPRFYLNNNGTISVFTGTPGHIGSSSVPDSVTDNSNANNATRNTTFRIGRCTTLRIRQVITVTAAIGSNFVAVDAQRIVGDNTGTYDWAGNQNYPSCRLQVWKLS